MDDLQEDKVDTLNNRKARNDRVRNRYLFYVSFQLANSAHPQGLLSVTDSSS